MKEFKTKEEAFDWMDEYVDDPCIDNRRVAEVGNVIEEHEYTEATVEGCCGFFDGVVLIGTRLYRIGCNYGH